MPVNDSGTIEHGVEEGYRIYDEGSDTLGRSFSSAMNEYWLDIGTGNNVDRLQIIELQHFIDNGIDDGWIQDETIINAEQFNVAASNVNDVQYGVGEYATAPPGGNGTYGGGDGNIVVLTGQTLTLPVNVMNHFRNLTLEAGAKIVPSSRNPGDKLIILVKETFTAASSSYIDFNGEHGINGAVGDNGLPGENGANGANGAVGQNGASSNAGNGGMGGNRNGIYGLRGLGAKRQTPYQYSTPGNPGRFSNGTGDIRIGSGGGGGGERSWSSTPGGAKQPGGINTPTSWSPQIGTVGPNGSEGSSAIPVSLGFDASSENYNYIINNYTTNNPLDGIDGTDGIQASNGDDGRGGDGGWGQNGVAKEYDGGGGGGGGGGGAGGHGGIGGYGGKKGHHGTSGHSAGLVYIEATDINIDSTFTIQCNGGDGSIGGNGGAGGAGGATGLRGLGGAGGIGYADAGNGQPGVKGENGNYGGIGGHGGKGGRGAAGNGGLIIFKYHTMSGGANEGQILGKLQVQRGTRSSTNDNEATVGRNFIERRG